MTARTTIVDYGIGNLLSVSRGLEHSGADVKFAGDAASIAGAERLVLPGVGAFGKATEKLHELGLFEAILRFIESGRPFLGICVGMQLMMDYSEEFGRFDGFSLIAGHVAKIPKTGADGSPHPVPHIGWNRLNRGGADWENTIFRGLETGVWVYFVHSFTATPESQDHVLSQCDYNGCAITAAIVKDNMTGCQFHPEKSGPVGLAILKNFIHDHPTGCNAYS